MARKKGPQRITALHERLSRDDKLQGESNSIFNHQTILTLSSLPFRSSYIFVNKA